MMDFAKLARIGDSRARALALYEGIFTDEEGRLRRGEALKLEALTTLHVLFEELKPESRVLDLGCGTGVYALPLAEAGHEVVALDLVPAHIDVLKAKITPGLRLEAVCQDAQEALDGMPDASFDQVLCLGPMYHLRTEMERVRLLSACRRVTKPGGKVFIAFINNDWVIATQTLRYEGGGYMTQGDYDKDSFRVEDFPFVFHTLKQAAQETGKAGLKTLRRVNTDGLSEMLEDRFAGFTSEEYAQWFRYHLYLREKPEQLGACNHWLFVCEGE